MLSNSLSALAALTTFFLTSTSFACSCGEYANVQSAASRADVIVAKVRTTALDPQQEGVGTLSVEEVIKGNLSQSTVTATGQDGLNCNGTLQRPGNSWIVLLTPAFEGNGYDVAGCAESSLPISADGKVTVDFDQPTNLDQTQFRQLIRREIIPSVKGLSCRVQASRNRSPFQNDDPLSFFHFFNASATGSTLSKSEDFSSFGPGLRKATVRASVTKTAPRTYKIVQRFTEPFSRTTRQDTNVVLIGEREEPSYVGFSKITDLHGNEPQSGASNSESTLFLQAASSCWLVTGLPLVPAE